MVGMISCNWLLFYVKRSNRVSDQIMDGIGPVNLLEDKPKLLNSERKPNSVGMGPSKAFRDRLRNVSLVSKPISVGRDPVNLLADKSRTVKSVSKPISLGMVPVRENTPQQFGKLDDVKLVRNGNRANNLIRLGCKRGKPVGGAVSRGLGLLVGGAVGVCMDPGVGAEVGNVIAIVPDKVLDHITPKDRPKVIAATRIVIATMPRNIILGRLQIFLS